MSMKVLFKFKIKIKWYISIKRFKIENEALKGFNIQSKLLLHKSA